VVAQGFNWSGFYIGAHVGGGWGRKDWNLDDFGFGVLTHRHDVDGILAGGQLGFNWQVGNFVFGAEGEASWADIEGNGACVFDTLDCRSKIRWLSSATGRLGFAWNAALLYVKGGWAWAGERFDVTDTFGLLGGNLTSGDRTRSGPTIGGGVEWGFGPNWSAKIEYMFTDFGRKAHGFDFVGLGLAGDASIKQHLHTVKFGVNYRFNMFGAGPVVASY
jgi:outer membrane immunogenic protein